MEADQQQRSEEYDKQQKQRSEEYDQQQKQRDEQRKQDDKKEFEKFKEDNIAIKDLISQIEEIDAKIKYAPLSLYTLKSIQILIKKIIIKDKQIAINDINLKSIVNSILLQSTNKVIDFIKKVCKQYEDDNSDFKEKNWMQSIKEFAQELYDNNKD